MQINKLEDYIDFMLSVALRKCGNLEDAKDLTQETFLSALVFLSKGGNIEDIRAWLVSVLKRKYYDMLRKKYKLPTISSDAAFDIAMESEDLDEMIKREDAEVIRREIAYLSRLYREVIVRRYIKGESVDQIAKALNIPIGTVKSRLFGGREQMKKGIDTMECYVKQSYEPETLYISCSGMSGMNDEPYSIVNDDLIVQNILLLGYHEPITEVELSKAIGIPTAYIEPVVNKLVENELMKRVGNKVYTDFIIFTVEDKLKHIPAQRQLVADNFELFWQPVNEGLNELKDMPIYKGLSERQKSKLDYYFVMHCLEIGIYNAGSRIYDGNQHFTDRPNGGRWIAFGNAYPKDYDFRQSEFFKYSWAGERKAYWERFLNSKSICFHVYDTPLEKSHYRHGNFPMNDGSLAQMLFILNQNINPDDTGFNLMFFENVPHLVECGVLNMDGGKTTVGIPVLSRQEYSIFADICSRVGDGLVKNTVDIMAKHLKNAKTVIPKHLTSVPEQKQYMQAMNCILMLIVYTAKDQGVILKNVDYPCPPMVFVIDL